MMSLSGWRLGLIACMAVALQHPAAADDSGNKLTPLQMLQVITPEMKAQIYQAFAEGKGDQVIGPLAEQTILTPDEAAFTLQMLEFEWKKRVEIDNRALEVLGGLEEAQRSDIISLVADRKNAAALALLRTHTGLSDEEAKPLIAGIQRRLADAGHLKPGATLPEDDPLSGLEPDQRDKILAFIADGKKIAAIKELRAATGLGLKDSKDLVETIISNSQ